jgi:hypothetical protein
LRLIARSFTIVSMAIAIVSPVHHPDTIGALTSMAISGDFGRQLTDSERQLEADDDFWAGRMVDWLGIDPPLPDQVYTQFAAMVSERSHMATQFNNEQGQRCDAGQRVPFSLATPDAQRSALIEAVRRGHHLSAHILLRAGQDLHVTDDSGLSLEEIAQVNGRQRMGVFLWTLGATVTEETESRDDAVWMLRIAQFFDNAPISTQHVYHQYRAMMALRERDVAAAVEEFRSPENRLTEVLDSQEPEQTRCYLFEATRLGFEFSVSCILEWFSPPDCEEEGTEQSVLEVAVGSGQQNILRLLATLDGGQRVWPLLT